ncbi:TRAP-type C4-dicarboxylate transport system, small permease component [Loktanella sp. DSM 29012]|uniref:TRAP transporter small permease n=1 Tax=Loktanella sp. DSM 29012 TaxID=1881056 RepID=UPI0008BEE1A3|nr:TRAP transporter small permease [Loktanella sp. DSM 29012]SEP65490.1 TRAP-type C4-dicarboxylate transport system, small permease component [Loktanella sp. DSM 29012]
MEALVKTGLWLRARAENILAALLLSMFVVFLLQVLFRYVLNISVDWTVEWVTLAWLWGILFGYAFVVKGREVIRLDMVYYAVSRTWRRVFDIFGGLVIAVIFIFTLPAVWDYIDFMARERTAALRIPFNWVFSIYMLFAVAVIIRALVQVWDAVTGRGPHVHLPQDPESHDYD